MPTPIDPKRLPSLRAALETFGPDDKAAQKDLAKLYGVANSRFTTLIKERFDGFPPAERRGDKTHWYPARAAIQAMIDYLEKRGKKNAAAAKRAAAVMGRATEAAVAAEPEADEPAPMGPAELDKMASAATRIWRLGIEMKKYVLAADVRTQVRSMLNLIKGEISGLPNAIDPNGELPPLMRARLEQRSREILVKLHDELEELLSDDADD